MAKYDLEELGFLDEMSKDECSIGRHCGRSQKNCHVEKKQVFVHGQRTSTEALLQVNLDGIVARTVVEGSMMKELFLEYLEFNVVSHSESSNIQCFIVIDQPSTPSAS